MATLTTSYQLIANKQIGTVSGSGVSAKAIYLRIYAKYTSQSIVDNKSYVSYKSTLYVAGEGTYFYTGNTTTKTLSGTGATTISADAQGNYYVGETILCETTGTITHGSNGAASVSITAGWSSTPWEVYGSVSGSADLPTIARTTTPTYSATSVEMGKSITITLKPATSDFKHKITYDFGSLTNQTSGVSIGSGFSAAGNTTVTFTPPTSLGSQIPTALSGVCKVTCSTYTSAGTLVGSVTSNVTLTIPSYTPTVTGITLTGSDLLSSAYVQGKSTVTVAATVGTSYGATTKSITTTIDGKNYSGLPFTTSVLSSGSKTAQITFVDSRDKSVTVTSSAITVYEYSLPNITEFTLARQSDGTTVIATIKGSIASVNSKNAKTIKVTLNGKTNTITSSEYAISATTTFTGVPTDSTLTGTASFKDSYVTIERAATLPTVAVTMDFYKDGNGIAMGKVSETTDLLDVAWSQRVRKNLTVDGTLTAGSFSPTNITNSGNATVGGTLSVTGATSLNKASTISDDVLGLLTLKRNHASNGASIKFQNNTSVLGYIGMTGSANGGLKRWNATDTNTAYTFLDTGNLTNTIKAYVTEEDGSGAWWWRKWSNGDMEVFGTLSQTPTALNNGTNSITATLPVSFVDTSFVVNITPAKCGLMVSAFGDCNSSNDKTHTVNSFVLSYKYNYSTAYTVNFNVTIVGKWK
jgi:hypothetical protein